MFHLWKNYILATVSLTKTRDGTKTLSSETTLADVSNMKMNYYKFQSMERSSKNEANGVGKSVNRHAEAFIRKESFNGPNEFHGPNELPEIQKSAPVEGIPIAFVYPRKMKFNNIDKFSRGSRRKRNFFSKRKEQPFLNIVRLLSVVNRPLENQNERESFLISFKIISINFVRFSNESNRFSIYRKEKRGIWFGRCGEEYAESVTDSAKCIFSSGHWGFAGKFGKSRVGFGMCHQIRGVTYWRIHCDYSHSTVVFFGVERWS